MGNARDTGYLQNIVTYDANDNIVLPADLSIAGNLGLGVTPSNSYAGSVSFEIGANGILWSEQGSSIYNSMSIGSNFYYNSAGSLLYKNTGVASSRYIQYQGSHFWYSAPSGTAGNAISFTEAMTLNASGNLLVGTTTDNGAKLQVSGAATFSSSVTASGNASTTPSFIANNSSSAGGTAQHYIDFTAGATVISRMSRGNGASGLAGNGLNIDNFDGFGVRLNQLGGSGGTFSVTGGAATFSSSVTATNLNLTDGGGAAINNVNGNLFIQTGAGTGWIFRNGPSGYAEYMRLTPTGSLGIGTTSPTTRLDIGNGTLTLPTLRGRTYQLSNVSSANPNFINGTGFNSIPVRVGDIIDLPFSQTRTVTAVTDTQITVDSAWTISFAGVNVEGRGAIVFQTNNLDRLTIAGSGNVGIGTTSPSTQFNVGNESHGVGISYLSSSALPALAGIFTSDGTAGGETGYGSLLVKARSDFGGFYSINFFTAASNNTPLERMRITSSGNVLIGTETSTGAKLEVNGDVVASNYKTTSGSLSVPSATYTTVFTFNNSDNMAGVFTVRFAFTNASTICFFTKTFDGGNTKLTVGSKTSRDDSDVISVSENAIQVYHNTGVDVTAFWSFTRTL